MPETRAMESVPLTTGDDEVIRIEGTRVPLETLVETFQEGATAEEIAQQYPTVPLGVVYQLIGYYLRHRSEVDAYVARRAAHRATTQVLNESHWPSNGIRERLLARRS
jgi:uncharacterized protein (DUF433 family)